jgi:hypothetical protein
VSEELREKVARMVDDYHHTQTYAQSASGWDMLDEDEREGAYDVANAILALLSAPEPAETGDVVDVAAHMQAPWVEWVVPRIANRIRDCDQSAPLESFGCDCMTYIREMLVAAIRRGAHCVHFTLGTAPADPRPLECSVCGAGYIGSRAGEECGVEGCDGRLYFVVAETGERDGYVMVPTQLLRTEWPPTPQLAPGHKRFDAVYESLLAGAPIREPLTVRYDTWTVIDGHHRITAARLLGIDVVPVRFWTGAAWVPSGGPAPTAAEPEREAPTPETERLLEAVLYGVRCGRGAVNDAACESIAREVIAALATPEAEGGSP